LIVRPSVVSAARLDVYNGLLLATHLEAAFRGFVAQRFLTISKHPTKAGARRRGVEFLSTLNWNIGCGIPAASYNRNRP